MYIEFELNNDEEDEVDENDQNQENTKVFKYEGKGQIETG